MEWLPCETLLMVKLPMLKFMSHVNAVPSRVTVVPVQPAFAMFGTLSVKSRLVCIDAWKVTLYWFSCPAVPGGAFVSSMAGNERLAVKFMPAMLFVLLGDQLLKLALSKFKS